MNKTQIIDAVAKATELKKKDAEAAINSVLFIVNLLLISKLYNI